MAYQHLTPDEKQQIAAIIERAGFAEVLRLVGSLIARPTSWNAPHDVWTFVDNTRTELFALAKDVAQVIDKR